MKKKILQKIADLIIKRLETSLIVGDNEAFDFFYSIGMQYDAFCITVFDVYLDWKKNKNTCKLLKWLVYLQKKNEEFFKVMFYKDSFLQ